MLSLRYAPYTVPWNSLVPDLVHRIDHGAGGASDSHVVLGEVDGDRLDGVDRDRLATGLHVVGFEAERVADGHAVDADRIEARVLAAR